MSHFDGPWRQERPESTPATGASRSSHSRSVLGGGYLETETISDWSNYELGEHTRKLLARWVPDQLRPPCSCMMSTLLFFFS